MRARGNKSGGGRLTRLHAFAVWPINAEGTGVDRTSPIQSTISRCRLNMTNAMIAPLRAARKWCSDYSLHKNSIHNLNDSQRRLCVRPRLCLATYSITAESRAISHAQSPKAV
jgi:hypothetical protein